MFDYSLTPSELLIFLDRYVNDGSPSGFTEKYKTSDNTDPFGTQKCFSLCFTDVNHKDFYTYPLGHKLENPLLDGRFYFHPDMKSHPDLSGCAMHEETRFSVSPTSSFRTVKMLSETDSDYIKLHYDGIIGRINRKLTAKKAIAGVEISNFIKSGINNNILSDSFCILEEPSALIFNTSRSSKEDKSWGMVIRKEKPYGKRADKIKYIVPLFSFWSKDRARPNKTVLGELLLRRWGSNAKHNYTTKILIPLLDSYFELLVNFGFQNEYNAQNILIGFDANMQDVFVINRDMMGIEKDLHLRQRMGLSLDFDSYPYKILKADDPLGCVRHSFAFDFKACHYVLMPLIQMASNCDIASCEELLCVLRERTSFWIKQLPENFFPRNKWYSHDNVLLSVERRYVENDSPLLR